MENIQDTTVQDVAIETPVEQPNFVMKVQNGDREIVLSIPAQTTHKEAFNSVLQLLLAIYDISKQTAVGEKKNEQ